MYTPERPRGCHLHSSKPSGQHLCFNNHLQTFRLQDCLWRRVGPGELLRQTTQLAEVVAVVGSATKRCHLRKCTECGWSWTRPFHGCDLILNGARLRWQLHCTASHLWVCHTSVIQLRKVVTATHTCMHTRTGASVQSLLGPNKRQVLHMFTITVSYRLDQAMHC